jgi:hypothetical protein
MPQEDEAKGAGWIMFAGVMMITIGIFQAFTGLVAIINDEFYVITPDYLLQFDATTWGWIHLIVGLIVLAAGFGVFSGNVLARTVGVLVALGSMLTNFAWLPWYPIWAITIIAIDVFVIWALTVHGRALETVRSSGQ